MNRNQLPHLNRRSTPKVKNGKVQRKNRSSPTATGPLIRREQPGPGFRHVVRKADIAKFLSLLPDWDELSVGLAEIVLARGEVDVAGWHRPGAVGICAWEHGDIQELDRAFVEAHAPLFDRLGITYSWVNQEGCEERGYFLVQYSDDSIRAYQLLHILLHELGHHHDRVTTKSQIQASRGESYAESYAFRFEALIFARYCETFGFRS